MPLSVVPSRRNLLRNADFDRLVRGGPADWARNGLPLVGAPPIGADSGPTAVRVTESDTFCQSIRVLPFQIYDLPERHARHAWWNVPPSGKLAG